MTGGRDSGIDSLSYVSSMKSFGKYQVVEQVGEGGFGTLYRGFDPLIQRTVAVKTCTSDDPEVRDRFFREAKIAGNLHHRNITIVHDFGIEAGVPYLVQEFLSGEDLHRKIEGPEQLPFGTKLLYLIQIARGLEYAHDQGVVHRDIKPSNIRVLPDGTVKIMDFGIAKVQSLHNSMTQTGETIGTAAYLSPEQIQGQEADARADIFSFGVLAYELLTGHRAFTGETPSTVLYAVLSRSPRPIRDHWPACPAEVQAVVDRCLEKDREQRYADCAELLAELNSLLDGKDQDLGIRPRSGVIAPPSGRIQSAMVEKEMSSADTVAIGRPAVDSARQRGNSGHVASPDPDSTDTGSDFPPQMLDEKLGPESSRQRSQPSPSQRSAIGILMLLLVISGLGTGIWWYGKGFRAIWANAPDRAGALPDAPASKEAVAQNGDLTNLDFEPTNQADLDPSRIAAAAEVPSGQIADLEQEALALQPNESNRADLAAGPDPLAAEETRTEISTPAAAPGADSSSGDPANSATSPIAKSSLAESLLTVRQLPGTERCYLRLDGRDVGWTPRQKLALPPGSYLLEIYLSEEATVPVLSQPLTLNRGMASIVTVDLDQGVVHSHERALSDEVPPSDQP